MTAATAYQQRPEVLERRRLRQREYGRQHPERRREAVRACYERKQDYINDYRASRGCVDCGETDFVVLDFDHRDPAAKLPMLREGASWAQLPWPVLLAELEKCDIRCANCHRRKTHAARRGLR